MKYQIVDKNMFIYGQFPNKRCANLALKGFSTMLDNLIIIEVK
jgi:hypothetical protein